MMPSIRSNVCGQFATLRPPEGATLLYQKWCHTSVVLFFSWKMTPNFITQSAGKVSNEPCVQQCLVRVRERCCFSFSFFQKWNFIVSPGPYQGDGANQWKEREQNPHSTGDPVTLQALEATSNPRAGCPLLRRLQWAPGGDGGEWIRGPCTPTPRKTLRPPKMKGAAAGVSTWVFHERPCHHRVWVTRFYRGNICTVSTGILLLTRSVAPDLPWSHLLLLNRRNMLDNVPSIILTSHFNPKMKT